MSHEGNDKIIDNIRDNLDESDSITDRPHCDPYVNIDHSDCTEEGCEFDEGAYL